jgi:signal transduction histidine kinase
VEVSLFRAVQEAVTNIIRHANAKNAWVTLHQDSDSVELIIRDDGDGFDIEKQSNMSNHLGFAGLQERARLLGGTAIIRAVVEEGTTVHVRVPPSYSNRGESRCA